MPGRWTKLATKGNYQTLKVLLMINMVFFDTIWNALIHKYTIATYTLIL
jgi:hypothetical protein